MLRLPFVDYPLTGLFFKRISMSFLITQFNEMIYHHQFKLLTFLN